MRLVATKSIKEGMKLGKAIYNDGGKILLNEGVVLDHRIMKRLLNLGIAYLYIQDSRTNDIKPTEVISNDLKRNAIGTIKNTFKEIQNNGHIANSFVIEKAADKFQLLIKNVLNELKNQEELFSILSDVYVYDDYIFAHSFNVTMYTLALGIELKLSLKDLELLGLGALLHDVGKMYIPLEILKKPGKLTDEEYEIVKRHPGDGFELLRKVHTLPLLVAHCAFQHHERLDGSGYPRNLQGNEIHLFGKIIAIADVFDAVTSNRVYRKAMLPHEGLEILYGGINTNFDKKMVEVFRKSIVLYPNGLTVELSNGCKGIVSKQNVGFNERPIVRILEVNDVEVPPYEVDLKQELSVVIVNCDMTFQS